jgi:hypothetical protein
VERGRIRFALLAAALVLGLRLIYLARFGADGCPMGYNFLAEARGLALRAPVEANGLPLTPLALWGLRSAGASAHAALAALYLLGHALLLFASLSLFDFFSPDAPARRRLLFVLMIAVVPMLSATTGYMDLAALLGAALMLGALACAFSAAAGRGRSYALLGAVATALLGAMCRFEALAGIALGSVVLFTFGRQVQGLRRPRAAALALFAGGALGVAGVVAVSLFLRRRAELTAATYGFYTFYDGLPWLMRAGGTPAPGEFGRYLASTTYFGSFADHRGNVASALRAHLGYALLRLVLKIPDLVAAALAMRGFTPAGVLLIGVGVREALRAPRTAARSRTVLLLAFVGPLGVLLVPPASAIYLVALIFPALYAMARGLDRLLARAPDRAVGAGAIATTAIAAALIALVGRTERTSSPVFAPAARDLESRCRAGCLVNYMPSALSSQVWAETDAAAPLPLKVHRSEEFVRGRFTAAFERSCRFEDRVRRARARGFSGPVLYVAVDTPGRPVFDAVLDPEHRFEGNPDLAGAAPLTRLTRGGDTVSIYLLP